MLFQTRAMRLSSELRLEAMRCVRDFSSSGELDHGAAAFVGSCETDYVADCVDRAILANSINDLTLRLRDILDQECNKV